MRSHGPLPTSLGLRATLAIVLVVAPMLALAQTPVKLPKNKYTPEQDVKLGRDAVVEVEKQLPLITDDDIVGYVNRLGRRLVDVAPPELDHPAFEYSFKVVNMREINAFALPGGPMYVNRGMIEAAGNEAEVAGVMAHELAHVLLRHGTANVTKAQNPWLQLGALGGLIAGAVVGGNTGAIIADGTQFGLGTVLLKYSREFEQQADLLGVQIMARAGYDPMALARMFETIERESKRGGPQWLSSHPNPGNRSASIQREAQLVRAGSPRQDSRDFDRVRARLASMSPAPTAAEVAARAKSGGAIPASVGRVGDPVPPPSTRYQNVRGGNLLTASVPENWQALSTNNSIKFVPRNGYGQVDGRTVFSHGVEMGVARASSRDLRQATSDLLESLARSNPQLRVTGSQQSTRLSQRRAITTPLTNRSEVTGRNEQVTLHTTFMADGNLFYYLTIAPSAEHETYRPAFTRVGQSIRLTESR
jgi:Zn-dependent protease with chaperone function